MLNEELAKKLMLKVAIYTTNAKEALHELQKQGLADENTEKGIKKLDEIIELFGFFKK